MKKTYHGSCHCQALRFEVDLDLAAGTSKCDCSFCTKNRYWKAFAKADEVRVRQGQDQLTDYQWGPKHLHHWFCRHCGARPYGTGELEELGGAFYAINLACLDDLSPEEWIAAPAYVMDGRHDEYEREAEVTGHL